MAEELVGSYTGLRGGRLPGVAVLVTAREVFESIRRSLDEEFGEHRGKPGFLSVAGRYSDREMLLLCIPPYPQAVVDSVRELYILGVRRVVYMGEGLKLRGDFSTLMALAAIPRDSISRQLAVPWSPLIASPSLVYSIAGSRGLVQEKVELASGVEAVVGTVVSVDSLGNENAVRKALSEASKLRGYVALDCCTSALYATRYVYAIDVVSLVFAVHEAARASTLLSERESERVSETLRELSIRVFPEVFEKVAGVGEERV